MPTLANILRGAAAGLLLSGASAQVEAPPSTFVDYTYDSGALANPSSQPRVVISFTVHHGGAQWLRLYFQEVELAGEVLSGSSAVLRLTSHRDGDVVEMNALHLRQWQSSSPYFNGDSVQVEVLAPPRSGASRVVLRGLDAGELVALGESICDTADDRVLSSDPRSARLLPIGCTGWLIDDCAKCMLTAGHCSGSLSVVEFNVPLSSSNGTIQHPPAADQYAVDAGSLQTNGGQGVGDDWAYFGTFANPVTGMTAFQAQGAAFALALPPSPNGNDIRITGYGTDNTPPESNQVQQTHVGPLVVSTPTAEVGYRTDTTGGNSGSPVIWEQTGEAVGIHTHGGCSSGGSGNNWGTASGHAGLQAALASPSGICSAGFSHPSGVPSILPPGVPTTVYADVLSPAATNVTLHYRYDGGAYLPVPMTFLGGQSWSADLPAPDCSDVAEFFFSADDPSCGTVTSPPGAPTDVFQAEVGTLVLAFADDFEGDQGWTATVQGATTGAWERGVPVNDPNWAYDPASDADGSGSCYLTQNEFGNTDVDNGSVRLESPDFDLSAGGEIRYAYYLNLTVEDGVDRLLLEVSPNGAAGPWTVVVAHDTSGSTSWREHAVSSADLVALGIPLTANMRARFTANDTGSASIVEAGLDAFTVGRIECGGPIGSIYCSPAVANSTGQPATIAASGSDTASDNDVLLASASMPANQFGYYLNSQTQGFSTPPGSQGNLCLGGGIGRYAKDVLSTGATGAFALQLDLTMTPTPSGPVAIVAGETWNFTTWYRDKNPSTTSNFTDAVSIVFQ